MTKKHPPSNDPALVKRLHDICAHTPLERLISNLRADFTIFEHAKMQFPLTISGTSQGANCYICDPVTAYIDYAIEETRNFAKHPIVSVALTGLIRSCAPVIRATGLGYQVQLNNWLFSTNPVPLIQDAHALRDAVLSRFPDRAIVMRSLNEFCDVQTIAALTRAGFKMIPARQIYLRDMTSAYKPKPDLKRDQKLLRETTYTVVVGHDMTPADFTRAQDLYTQLYLDKYTDLNPQYTAYYLQRAQDTGLLKFTGLRGPDGQLDGVVGIFENGPTMTVPLIGYDTSKPQKTGLYRMLNAITYEAAAENAVLYNLSAGAAAFKRNRNAEPAIEYMAVYVAHLGLRQRIAVQLVKTVLDWVGVPLLRKFKL